MTNIWTKLGKLIINPALVAQRIEHLTTDQKVGGSSPSKRAKTRFLLTRAGFFTSPRAQGTLVNLAG